MFSVRDILKHSCSKAEWHKFIRAREIIFSLSLLGDKTFNKGLEIGAGDGGQSEYLRSICNYLVCTEVDEESHRWTGDKCLLERNVNNISYKVCDAQDLSCFQKEEFDFIYSSNVLEHIPNVDKCLLECKKVLTQNGIMLHIMPTRWWKIFNYIFFFLKFKKPLIHGEFLSHIDEFKGFGKRSWISKFRKARFELVEIAALPFYIGHGHHFRLVVIVGNILKIPSSYIYILRNKK